MSSYITKILKERTEYRERVYMPGCRWSYNAMTARYAFLCKVQDKILKNTPKDKNVRFQDIMGKYYQEISDEMELLHYEICREQYENIFKKPKRSEQKVEKNIDTDTQMIADQRKIKCFMERKCTKCEQKIENVGNIMTQEYGYICYECISKFVLKD